MFSNKFNFKVLFNIFIDIKMNLIFIVKLIVMMMVFLILNYNSYIYRRLGITISYGVVLIFSLRLVRYSWFLWIKNSIIVIISHFLPLGVEGVLKIFIPVLEIIGVIIRPLTLAVRLATNISCGHVVLSIFSYFAFNLRLGLVFRIRVLLFGLYFIEFLVCLIQAYVFWRLLYIYFGDIEI